MKTKKILFNERKAIRKGNRDGELENSTGFISKQKPHKNKKIYNRKNKKQGLLYIQQKH